MLWGPWSASAPGQAPSGGKEALWKPNLSTSLRDADQDELPHIDDDDKDDGENVGAEYYHGVLKMAHKAGEDTRLLLANDGIKNSDYQPKVENEEKLKSGREVGKGGIDWVGHLENEIEDDLFI